MPLACVLATVTWMRFYSAIADWYKRYLGMFAN